MFLIAEIGVNHGGKLEQAMKLVDAAKRAGADCAKFQLFDSERLWGDSRIKHLELRYDEMEIICNHCQNVGLEFLCTPFGVAELTFLVPMLERVKIASGCITRFPLLQAARESGLPVIMSTGMSNLEVVSKAVSQLAVKDLTLLHCTSSYPCRLEDVNLRAMTSLRRFGKIGYSDHTDGLTVAISACALGATVIEKHLTLDRNQTGPDHKSSITPNEFKALRMALVEVEAALGDGIKRVMDAELPLLAAWRGN